MVNSNLLNQIGLGSVDIGYILIILLVLILILLIMVIVMLNKISKLNKRCNSFMKGKAGKSQGRNFTDRICRTVCRADTYRKRIKQNTAHPMDVRCSSF